MTARELIALEIPMGQRYETHGTAWEYAAERVIERLQRDMKILADNYSAQERRAKAAEKRVEELEEYVKAEDVKKEPGTTSVPWQDVCDNYKAKQERYRDRLDRMVAAGYGSAELGASANTLITECVKILAAIDAAVEERK